MKKFFALLLVVCIGLVWLPGCSEKSGEPASSIAQDATPTPDPTATPEPTDKPISMESTELKGVKFSTPSDWSKTENESNVIFVTSYKDSSLLSVDISEFSSEIDVSDSTFRSGYIIGLSSVDGYKAITTDDITIRSCTNRLKPIE